MELTWVAAGSVLLVGVGYVSVRAAHRLRPACWLMLCTSLFALATRDLFRPRERGHPISGTGDTAAERSGGSTADERQSAGDECRSATDEHRPAADERRPALAARLRRRVADWLG